MNSLVLKMLNCNYVELSIPLFLGLPVIEFLLGRRSHYRLNDTLNSLTCGVMQQLFGLYLTSLMIYWYDGLEQNLGLFELEKLPLGAMVGIWLVMFVLVDFFYYWFHRFAHVVNIGWAAHIVHHQSEDYYLVTGLRQAVLQTFFSQFFYWPLALIGVPVGWLISLLTLNFVYQFWIHTQEIRKMPSWFEAFFNTPAHHRVHHGQNPQYLDKNFAGTLIIWDRMFGTFEPEVEPPIYGIVSPLRSWNPVWAQIHYLVTLTQATLRTKGLGAKLGIWFLSPTHLSRFLKKPQEFQAFEKYDPSISRTDQAIAIVAFGLGLGITLFLLLNSGIDEPIRITIIAAAVLSLTLSGLALDGWKQIRGGILRREGLPKKEIL